MIGQKLGNYQVTGHLGRGGMGVVYEGKHALMGNKVAIKVLRPEFSHKKQLVQRFFNEAKAATRIEHPGIVKVFDFGEHTDGSNYIIMEFLPGEPLAARLGQSGRISLGAGLRLLQQCASALEAAHRAGIIHRDLKPDNIFLCPDPDITGGERVKLLDFGVAKLVGDLSASDAQTRTGALIGTPRYMSPEQCAGGSRTVDHRADLYALGCVGFAMLCGRPPFLHDGLGELLAAHMFQAPPVASSLEPSLPQSLDLLLACLLAKEPAQRYQTADEVSRILEAIGQGLDIDRWPTGRMPMPMPIRPGRGSASQLGPVATTLGGAPVSVAVATSDGRRWLQMVAVVAVVAGLAVAGWLGSVTDEPSSAVVVVADAGVVAAVDAGEAVDEHNRWVRIEPPPAGTEVVLGVWAATVAASKAVQGLRPERRVQAPRTPFAIQQHEVTWGEMQPWLDEHPEMVVHRPEWLPAGADRRKLWPATGVPWLTAQAYCAVIGGRLPTEAEWEYAARGAERRPYAWGDERLDRHRTHAYAGSDGRLAPVMTRNQDRTPGALERALYDTMGNAQEWTADLWRNDAPGGDESWVQKGEATYRAVRGLPPHAPPPDVLPIEGAAYRDALCATPACINGSEWLLAIVGVRCARDVRGTDR